MDAKVIGIPGVDTWKDEVIKLVNDELKLPFDDNDVSSNDSITYKFTDSDTFSRIYSRINKSTNFTYVDNESYYDDTTISLVYDFDAGKATLSGDLSTDSYKLEVVR